jgi:SWI/SNF-related matrix-associated actin-dependent regulator 1 of chromatin subfamily A
VEIARTRTPGMLTADIVVIGYAVVSAWQEHLIERGVAALVVDEAHACKNRAAQRTKAVRALAKNVRPDGLIMLLTGTPILNRPAELVSPLQILGVIREWGGVRGFLRQYCGTPDLWGRWSGARNLDVLNRRLRATCMVRREKTDVLADLPPKRWAQVVVEHSDLADYRRAEREFLDWLAEHVDEEERDEKVAAALRAEVLVRLTALRKHAAVGKLDAARQWIEDFRESGRALVVSAHHREVLETLARDLDAPVIMGGQSEQARQEAIDRFQRGAADVIVVGITAGGVGITLHRASDVLILERPWTWAALEQMADRVHRIGQDRPVTVWLMDAESTIDERLATMIDKKRRIGDEAIATRVLRGEW